MGEKGGKRNSHLPTWVAQTQEGGGGRIHAWVVQFDPCTIAASQDRCAGLERLATCQTISRHIIIHTDPRYIGIAMSSRKSFSGFRKKAKDKLSKIGGRMKEIQASVGGDDLYRLASSSQSEPAVVIEDESKGDPKVSGGRGDPQPDDSLLASRSAVEIGHTQGECDDKVDGGGPGQEALHPHSYVQAESGSNRERSISEPGQINPFQSDTDNEPTPAPPISPARGSESM